MLVKYDAILDELRENDGAAETVASLPTSGSYTGQLLIQSSDHTLYGWYANTWQAIFTFPVTPPTGTAGEPIGLLLTLTKAA